MFLLPGLVIGSYVSGMGFKEEEKLEMIRYLFNRAHPHDGGWGMRVLDNYWSLSFVLILCSDILKGTLRCLGLDSIIQHCAYWEYLQNTP
jgi:hypothetical protein